jgi:hypothetical protein
MPDRLATASGFPGLGLPLPGAAPDMLWTLMRNITSLTGAYYR